MNKALVNIGKLGKAHGLNGEIKVRIEEVYLDDAMATDPMLVQISGQHIPYFIETWRSDGTIIKLEDVDSKEAATLLQQKEVFLPKDKLSEQVPDTVAETPFDHLIDWTIKDITEGEIGKIASIIDLPQHYLAEVQHGEKLVMIPLHDDLVHSINEDQKVIEMDLPEGLLEL